MKEMKVEKKRGETFVGFRPCSMENKKSIQKVRNSKVMKAEKHRLKMLCW